MVKIIQIILSIVILNFSLVCKSLPSSEAQSELSSQSTIPNPTENEILPAPVDGEKVFDENGEDKIKYKEQYDILKSQLNL